MSRRQLRYVTFCTATTWLRPPVRFSEKLTALFFPFPASAPFWSLAIHFWLCARNVQSNDEVTFRQITTLDVNVQARDRELREIAKSISQLAELFKDLSALVIDQGTVLDSVEYNIEQTAVQMEDAVRELDTATKYVRKFGSCFAVSLALSYHLEDAGRGNEVWRGRGAVASPPCSLLRLAPSSHLALPLLPPRFSVGFGEKLALLSLLCAAFPIRPGTDTLSWCVCAAQVPEEHRAAPVHLPPAPDHLRPHHHSHLQATSTLCEQSCATCGNNGRR